MPLAVLAVMECPHAAVTIQTSMHPLLGTLPELAVLAITRLPLKGKYRSQPYHRAL
jgi:hypothetical protein